ncbi:MAG: PepSY domain-containing protein [Neomegalonema sp.]|nr:PepSY domain-containing protein [Neomegalonema sp.]
MHTMMRAAMYAMFALGGAGLVAVAPSVHAQVGLTDAAIKKALAEQGYELVKLEREQGELEAYAKKEGKVWELELDPKSGSILEAEIADEEAKDEDDEDDAKKPAEDS